MAKVTIAGNAVVVTSALKLEDLATIKKYRDKALTLMGGENNKEEIFTIDVGNGGCGEINAYGAYFCNATHDAEKKACITMCMEGATGDIKEFVTDKLGAAIIHLNKLEQVLPGILEEISAEKATIMENITVAQ